MALSSESELPAFFSLGQVNEKILSIPAYDKPE
jgi:hypothetical protein